MAYSVLQFVLWNIFQVLFVCCLLNIVIVLTCLQHTFLAFDLHGVGLPSFNVFKFFLTLLFSIQCVPIVSWMFLFRLNAVLLVHFWKFLPKFFLMVLVIFCRNHLYVITRGILSDVYGVSFLVIRSILLSRLILLRCSLINDGS